MSIVVSCECGQTFETDNTNAGRRARCSVCGHVLTVPAAPRAAEVFYIPPEPPVQATCRKAITSILLSTFFFIGCLSGLPAIVVGLAALKEIRQSGGRLRGRKLAIAGIVLGVMSCILTYAFLAQTAIHPREAARRAQCVNNLKQIGLAMHNYLSEHGVLPTAAISDSNGKPLLSWRVAILSYLESGSLYSEFQLDEPWNSPHNLALLDRMPNVYRCPSHDDLDNGMTSYVAVVGPNTAFTADFKPLSLRDFTDGTATTLLIGELRHQVPWTKPQDMPFDVPLPLNGLGSHHKDGFNALFGDGHVRFLKDTISPQVFNAILTRNGNEAIATDPL